MFREGDIIRTSSMEYYMIGKRPQFGPVSCDLCSFGTTGDCKRSFGRGFYCDELVESGTYYCRL